MAIVETKYWGSFPVCVFVCRHCSLACTRWIWWKALLPEYQRSLTVEAKKRNKACRERHVNTAVGVVFAIWTRNRHQLREPINLGEPVTGQVVRQLRPLIWLTALIVLLWTKLKPWILWMGCGLLSTGGLNSSRQIEALNRESREWSGRLQRIELYFKFDSC